MDFTTQTPAEIDTALASLYNDRHTAGQTVQAPARMYESNSRYNRAEAADRWRFHHYPAKAIELAEGFALVAQVEVARLDAEIEPREAEYAARNWTRAYFVKNAGGHVHTSRSCNTCFASTEFAWITQDSGKDTDAIVEEWGESACTVCHPTAPTNPRFREPSRRNQQAIADRMAERAARIAAKAAKAAKAALRGLVAEAVDGLIAANLEAVPGEFHTPRLWGNVSEGRAAAKVLAADHGIDGAALVKKARAKWNREGFQKAPTMWNEERNGPRPDGVKFPGIGY